MGRLGQLSRGLTTVAVVLHVATCVFAIIVLGITAWAVQTAKTSTVIYTLTISVLTLAFCLGALVLGALKPGRKWFAAILLAMDMIFAFLWLAAFVLFANDFNRFSCSFYLWRGQRACSRKWSAEAFTFLAFFFTLASIFLEIYMLYSARDGLTGDGLSRHSEKRLSGHSATTSEGTHAVGAPRGEHAAGTNSTTTDPAAGTGVGTGTGAGYNTGTGASYAANPEAGTGTGYNTGTGTGYGTTHDTNYGSGTGTGTGTGLGYGTGGGTTESTAGHNITGHTGGATLGSGTTGSGQNVV